MRTLAVAAVVLALASPASAQQHVQLAFDDGKVTLDAPGVPVRAILAEWARLGGTRIVNLEKITGGPVTLRLEGVPEAQALQIILRNVAGYMAAPRRADSTGASAYDRILVLATSAAPAATAARNAAPANTRGGRAARGGFAAQQPRAFDEEEPQDTSDTGVNEPPAAFAFPEQNPFQGAGQPGPFGTPVPPSDQPPVFQFAPGQPGGFGGSTSGVMVNPSAQPAMPVLQFPTAPPDGAAPGGFGVFGSPMPGVVMQPQPAPGQRPPGDR